MFRGRAWWIGPPHISPKWAKAQNVNSAKLTNIRLDTTCFCQTSWVPDAVPWQGPCLKPKLTAAALKTPLQQSTNRHAPNIHPTRGLAAAALIFLSLQIARKAPNNSANCVCVQDSRNGTLICVSCFTAFGQCSSSAV